ncbi:MAG: hypothetical protein RML74_04560 [Acidobacteriota bacterium]|nr:hypothetical protein [Blastocatellia bacterium]MDW8167747.1 hypothetical protein [Acidobacteriota bacterium]MDW8256785.1 hypothetical protein [Acidobacteriota bacterium]
MISAHRMSDDLFIWIGLGLAIGLVSSMPIGPINAAFAVIASRGEESQGLAFAAIVALLDGGYAFAALSATAWGRLLPSPSVEIAACMLLIGYGASLLIPRRTSPAVATGRRGVRGALAGVALGSALYLSNPAFAAFWIGTAFALRTKLPTIALPAHRFGFALGVSAGVSLWFAVLREILHRYPLPLPRVRRMMQGMGILLIGLGAYLMAKRL